MRLVEVTGMYPAILYLVGSLMGKRVKRGLLDFFYFLLEYTCFTMLC